MDNSATINKKHTKWTSKVKKEIRYVMNGKILQRINWKENWIFIVYIFVLIIILIYRNLSYSNKIDIIEKYNKEIMLCRDKAMDIKEENYNIGLSIEKSLLEMAEENNFNTSGYLPFVIQPIEKGEKD